MVLIYLIYWPTQTYTTQTYYASRKLVQAQGFLVEPVYQT